MTINTARDRTALPKWARDLLSHQDRQIAGLTAHVERMEKEATILRSGIFPDPCEESWIQEGLDRRIPLSEWADVRYHLPGGLGRADSLRHQVTVRHDDGATFLEVSGGRPLNLQPLASNVVRIGLVDE